MMMGGGLLILLGVLFLFVLLVAGLIFAGVWYMSRGPGLNMGGPPTPPARDQDPREVLRRRYAQGEITREEYESMREDLRE
ncbi:MAG TPA: SHOCT domain-containing protein [Anaerolineae bacterium]|nr:SHOCT domain-containing protein [Anaerolineae bacterium]